LNVRVTWDRVPAKAEREMGPGGKKDMGKGGIPVLLFPHLEP